MTHKPPYSLYIASCAPDGGIRQYWMDNNRLEPGAFTPMDRPMYMIISGRRMYVLLRSPFGTQESGLISYDIVPDGSLRNPSRIQSTQGEVACHLCTDGNSVYAVNYLSGSVIRMPDRRVVHTGNSIHPARQAGPHTHYVNSTPDQKYLLVTDLGTDQIYLYDKELSPRSHTAVPAGHGPRHLAFHEDGCHVFCVNELKSTVSLLKYTDGRLLLTDTVSTLPEGYTGESTSAAIRCVGNTVYTSNRGHDSISVLDFTGDHLRLRTTIPTFGQGPRDFIIMGDRILAANEKEHTVSVISLSEHRLISQTQIQFPVCIVSDIG